MFKLVGRSCCHGEKSVDSKSGMEKRLKAYATKFPHDFIPRNMRLFYHRKNKDEDLCHAGLDPASSPVFSVHDQFHSYDLVKCRKKSKFLFFVKYPYTISQNTLVIWDVF